MNEILLKIQSDFVDFYDNEQSNKPNAFVYNRFYSDTLGRGVELNWLRQRNVKVLEVKAVREFSTSVHKLVVYRNPEKHQSKGKEVLTRSEAIEMYPNALASQFFEESSYSTYKYLQIGRRRWNLSVEAFGEELREGKATQITEIDSAYNKVFARPIFSIDYIEIKGELIAIDFNKVQKLEHLGLSSIVTGPEVMNELYMAMVEYGTIHVEKYIEK